MNKPSNIISKLGILRFVWVTFCFFNLQLSAQDLLGYKEILGGSSGRVSFIKNHHPNDRISFLKINTRDIVLLKDLSDSLSQVRYLGLEFDTQPQLDSLCRSLSLFPNLEAVVFNELKLFRIDTLEPVGTLHLDESFYQQNQLKAIAFEGNSKINLAGEIGRLNKLPMLHYFIFSAFPAQHIPKGLKENQQLKGISLAYKPLLDQFEFPSQLREFDISSSSPNDRIDHVLDILPNRKRIEILSLNYFKIKDSTVYTDRGFTSLKKLDLNYNDTDDLGRFMHIFSGSSKLEKLSFIYGPLKQISSGLFQFKELRELRIKTTKPGFYLPEQLSGLKKLRVLDLAENAIDSLPDALFQLTELTDLNLSYNQLTSLSTKIGRLKNLNVLQLQSNRLKRVPVPIGRLQQLRELNLQANPIVALPSFIGLKKLHILNLSFCNLGLLPEDIGALSSLKDLDVSDNFLVMLPESITQLSKLEKLRVSTNLLQKLPEHMQTLTNLRELYVDVNHLKQLPVAIGNLDQLRILHLSHNDLTVLPESLGQLANLQEFYAVNDRPSHYSVYDSYRKIYRKDNPKTNRQLASTALRSFPKDLKNWNNMKTIRISNNDFSSFDIIKALFTIPSRGYTVNLSNCHISSLPSAGWAGFLGKELSLGANNIKEVPMDMVNAPLLAELSFRQNKLPESPKNQNTHAEKRSGVLLYFQQIGLMAMDDLPNDNNMVNALVDRSGQCFTYDKDYKTTVELADKAIQLNPDLARKTLSFRNVGESRFKLGDYNGAISDLTRAIQRDTAGPIRIMNFVVPAFDYRARSYLAIKDTLAALQDYLTLSTRFRTESWTDVGALYQKINQKEKAVEAFQKTIDYYLERIADGRESEEERQLYKLCVLEIYIISDQPEKAKKYATTISSDIKAKDLAPIYLYLNTVINIVENDKSRVDPGMFKDKVGRNWGYDLLYSWIDGAGINSAQKKLIRDLTRAMEKLR
ncbi:hypothetical protein BWD42_07065 [Sphingobacterium sp. CZ-UAM]|uniref:leucine-rich repeat domain-containing protein n=1 Tax=Sphingobacterium sp. CZ-UAM TaxID=1933868 RepID=UPI0009852960|nr:leucine-rich repeat domain-containing protein [Sphingobacterium sp. CZ-UAM]OOG19665.1 hypothetical protein BWD42_07065 [Sphingobacterium sp. CZ-UAM]